MRRKLSFFTLLLLAAVACTTFAPSDGVGLGPDGSCPILTLLPFSNQEAQRGPQPQQEEGDKQRGEDASKGAPGLEASLKRWPNDLLHHFSYSYLAAAQMAIEHFNARNPVVVPQLAELTDCTVQFPYQVVVDSALRDAKSIMGVLSAHHGRLSEQFVTRANNNNNGRRTRQLLPDRLPEHVVQQCPSLSQFSLANLLPPWCAVLGPKGDRSVTQTSALTGALEIPQIIYGPVGHLALGEDVPTTVGLSLPDQGRAKATVSFLQRPGLARRYLAILHVAVPSISDMVKAIKSNGKKFGLKAVAKESQRSKPGEPPSKAYRDGVRWLRRTGMKTILLGLNDPQEIRGYADVLDDEGMLDNDYVYLLLEEGVSLDRVGDIFGELQPGSPLDKLLSGAAVISQTDKFGVLAQQEDPFEMAWKVQNASFVEYLNEMTPRDPNTGEPLFQAEPTFFQDQKPAAMATYMYDSVIAVGLGACRHQQLLSRPEQAPLLQQPIGNLPLQAPGQQKPWEQVEPSLPQQTQEGGTAIPEETARPEQSQGGTQVAEETPRPDQPPPQHDEEGYLSLPGQGQQQAQPPLSPPKQEDGQPQLLPQQGQAPRPFPRGQQQSLGQQPPPPQEQEQQQWSPQQQGQQLGQGFGRPPQGRQEEGSQGPGGRPPQGQPHGQRPQWQQQGQPPQEGDLQQGQPPQEGDLSLGPPPDTGRLLESRVSSWGNAELGLLPTVDRLFAKIESALYSMQRHDNTSEFVSRVHVAYNDTFGYPHRMLIVYDIPRSDASDTSEPRSYNEFTFFATITHVESLDRGPKIGAETPAPSIEVSTTITTRSELQKSLEVFIRARSLWDSHHMVDYQFDYDLFFDTRKSHGANRHLTPYPWKVIIEDLTPALITDAKGTILFPSATTLNPATFNSSSMDVFNETAFLINATEAPTTWPATSNLTTTANATAYIVYGDFNATSAPTTWNTTGTNNATTQAPVQYQWFETDDEMNSTAPPLNATTSNITLAENHLNTQDHVNATTSNMTLVENQTTTQDQQIESEDSDVPPTNPNQNSANQSGVPPVSIAASSNLLVTGSTRPRGTGAGRGQNPPSLVDSILDASFDGASGAVSFRYHPDKSRDISGVPVGAYNIRPSPVNESTGLRTHSASLTSYAILTNDTTLDVWMSLPNEDFIYRSGSRLPPTVLRQIDDQNFLSEWVHIVGMTLFASALFLAVSAAISVWYFRNDKVMRAGQPPFLYLLCLGSAIMSWSIFTLSWDESYGWSQQQLDAACTLTPWFFFVGHLLMFSALFTKMWRVDQVMQFKRGQTVRVIQVVGPLVLLLLAASIVLSVWTIIDPWVWERVLIQESPAETYGECTSEQSGLFFLLLTALIVLGKVTTAVMAWKTADIPQDFSDTSSVFYAISTHLQAWFIGIPILAVLGNDSPDATYFGRVLLIWIFSVSGVSLVVVPKIIKAIQVRRNPSQEKKHRVVVSAISDPRSRTRASYSKGMDESTKRRPSQLDESSKG